MLQLKWSVRSCICSTDTLQHGRAERSPAAARKAGSASVPEMSGHSSVSIMTMPVESYPSVGPRYGDSGACMHVRMFAGKVTWVLSSCQPQHQNIPQEPMP